MTLSAEEKKALSKYRLEKAGRLLEDSALLLKEKRWESSVNRSYYAALSAAKAVLILLGVDPKTHDGVKTMVSKELVLTDMLSKEHGKWFRDLLLEREDVDYADFVNVDASDAEQAHQHARGFVDKTRDIIATLSRQI